MEKHNIIGKNIRKRRKQLKLTQEALSGKCNFSRTYIGLIERGIKTPSIMSLICIANQLEVGVDYLVMELLNIKPESIREDIATYYANIPKDKQESLKVIFKTIVEEYSKD